MIKQAGSRKARKWPTTASPWAYRQWKNGAQRAMRMFSSRLPRKGTAFSKKTGACENENSGRLRWRRDWLITYGPWKNFSERSWPANNTQQDDHHNWGWKENGWYMHNPVRRNRNIGTAKQGYKRQNRFVIPESRHHSEPYCHQLGPHTQVVRRINQKDYCFLVEQTRAQCCLPAPLMILWRCCHG